MIDVKKFEQLNSMKAELDAELFVCKRLKEYMIDNTYKCINDRLFCRAQTWRDVSRDIQELLKKRINNLETEIQKLREQLDEEEA